MNLFKANELALSRGSEAGFECVQPDSWSIKLSLLSLPEGWAQGLSSVMEAYAAHDVRARRRNYRVRIMKYARDAELSSTGGEAHKYVLLNEGMRASPRHTRLIELLTGHGLGTLGCEINLVPTPLLRATHESGNMLMPMPYTYKAAYTAQAALFSAVVARCHSPDDPDPEMDLQGHAAARWGQHSWRRMGEKVARDSQHIHKMPKVELDLYSGWELYQHSRDMQLHYAGQQRGIRVRRCAITEQI